MMLKTSGNLAMGYQVPLAPTVGLPRRVLGSTHLAWMKHLSQHAQYAEWRRRPCSCVERETPATEGARDEGPDPWGAAVELSPGGHRSNASRRCHVPAASN